MKKTGKFVTLMLSLVMIMSFPVFAAGEYEIGQSGLNLNPESQSSMGTSEEAVSEYSQTYSYTSQVDCSLNFQPLKNDDSDKHKNVGTYKIEIAAGNGAFSEISETQAANYAITAKTNYHIRLTRMYPSPVKNPFVGYVAKLNPISITTGTSVTASGDKHISTYYTFTPSTEGGYVFKLAPSNGCIGTDKNYQVNVYSKVGSSVNEFACYEKGVSDSTLRLYLKANTEYIVEALGYGANGLGYTFTVDSVPLGPGVALVGAPALSLDADTSCALYPFANRRAFSWYSFTAPKDGCFEFEINNKYDSKNNGDIIVELRDETFAPVEDEDVLYLYQNESDVISKTMKQGEVCYIQIAEMYKGNLPDVYNVGIRVKEHTHKNKIVVDGTYVMKGCPCQDDSVMEYAFWLDKVKLGNVAYTGKTASPKASFDIIESFCKEGVTIPTIPESAYTVTVTSKNTKNIGAAKAKVKFVGEYKGLGTYTVSFKIVPKGTTLSSVKAGSNSFTAKWKKQTSKTSGYQIRYSLYEGMYSAKTVTINSNKTTSKKISKLQENTAYYVQVRTYKTVGGKKYYSSWSGKTGVTTK